MIQIPTPIIKLSKKKKKRKEKKSDYFKWIFWSQYMTRALAQSVTIKLRPKVIDSSLSIPWGKKKKKNGARTTTTTTGRTTVHVSWSKHGVGSYRGWSHRIKTLSEPDRYLESPRGGGERLFGHRRELRFSLRFSSFSSIWGTSTFFLFCFDAEKVWEI